MSNRLLLQSSTVDGYLLEDSSGVVLFDSSVTWPASDITVTNFTGTPVNTAALIYTNADEMVIADTDYIYSTNGTVGVLEIKFDSMTNPINKTGHILTYRIANTNAGALSGTAFCLVTAELYQGAVLIKADTQRTTTAAWATFTLTLTNLEANAINDYSDLRVRFTTTNVASRGVGISYVALTLPRYIAAIEENQLTNTETFGSTWVKTGITVTNNVLNSPSVNGSFTASSSIEDTANTIHALRRTRQLVSNETVCFSMYVKANGRTICRFYFDNNLNRTGGIYVDLTTGLITTVDVITSDYTDISGYTVDVGDGWYFLSVTATKAAVNTNNYPLVGHVSTGTTTTYTGDGVSGLYVAMAQLNKGTVPANYIKNPISVSKKLTASGVG